MAGCRAQGARVRGRAEGGARGGAGRGRGPAGPAGGDLPRPPLVPTASPDRCSRGAGAPADGQGPPRLAGPATRAMFQETPKMSLHSRRAASPPADPMDIRLRRGRPLGWLEPLLLQPGAAGALAAPRLSSRARCWRGSSVCAG
jgi:hypothetical protein